MYIEFNGYMYIYLLIYKLYCTVLYCTVLLTQYCSGDQIETNEMDGACSTNGREARFIQDFGGET